MKNSRFGGVVAYYSLCTTLAGVVLLLFGLSRPGAAVAQVLPPNCGALQLAWGPFDYRADRYIPNNTYRTHSALLAVVEVEHFTAEVEHFGRGKNGGPAGPDLSYTLAVFPNHHRALVAISNLGLREKSLQPKKSRYSIDCYFKRALAFRPDDLLVRLIYANYLIQITEVRDAEEQIDIVARQNPENALTHRNLSLLYIETKNYEKALAHAHKASQLGLNIDTLKDRLSKLGQWEDAPAHFSSSASESAAAQSKEE
jgi:tetratricopeptide (TPR) repeat protein